MFAKSVVLLVTVCALSNAFRPVSRLTSRTALRMSEAPEAAPEGGPEQTVQDLNLEEMFEVFEAADEATPDEKKSTPSKASASGIFGTEGAKKTVGASGPLGFFDPAGFTVDVDESQYKLYQEAETKHCRVAMLAFLGIVIGELINPDTPAIYQYQQMDGDAFSLWALVFCAWIEGGYIIRSWQPLGETMKEPLGVAKLRADAVPGDYKFDILKKKPKTEDAYNIIKTKELNNGRLAMLAVAGIVAQELITGTSIF